MNGLSHPRLMRESQRRVEQAALSFDAPEHVAAERVLSNVSVQLVWEHEHSRYMHELADQARRRRQVVALRVVALRLIHRRAVFEYLRCSDTSDAQRRRVVALFHGSQSYSHAVISEPPLFLRSALSQRCTEHTGRIVIDDPAFGQPLGAYVDLFAAHFRLFCEIHGLVTEPDDPRRGLPPYMKTKIAQQRQLFLDYGDKFGSRFKPRPPATNSSARLSMERFWQ